MMNMGLIGAVIICAVLGLTTGKSHGSGALVDVSLVRAVGDNVLFNTSQDPAPYTNLSWTFGGTLPIISVSAGLNFTNPTYADRITLLADGSLELRNLTFGDRGDYTITVKSTEVPEFNSVFLLDVLQPVSDVRLSVNVTDLTEWSVVTLSCSASGSDLQYTWYNQSHNIGHCMSELNLTVKRYDTGPFRCEAYNNFNRISSEGVNFTINYGPDVILTAVPLQDTYTEGSAVTLTCTVDSKPEAQISWTQNGFLSPFNGTKVVLEDVTFHSGLYICMAYNHKTNLTSFGVQDIIVEYSSSTGTGLSLVAILACAAVMSCAPLGLGYLFERKRRHERNRTLIHFTVNSAAKSPPQPIFTWS